MRRICSTHGDMSQESVENFSGKIAGEFRYKVKVKIRPCRLKSEYIYLYIFFNLGARLLWVVNTTFDSPESETCTQTQHSQEKDIHDPTGFETVIPANKRE